MLSLAQGEKLVELARHAIETLLNNEQIELEKYKELNQKQGVFVSLKKEGKLIGQMGVIETDEPLYKAVFKAARDSAFHDKRFEKVTLEDIKEIEIEVHLILQPRLLKIINSSEYEKLIRPETDGLMVKSGLFNAIMLPNPEMRLGWDVERVLRHLCISAGLTIDAWKSLDQNIYTFQVQTFGERAHKVVELI